VLAETGQLNVIDFGLCVFGEEAIQRCGTPGYMAPEVSILSKCETTARSSKVDIYSAGVILFEMLYGFPPWPPLPKDKSKAPPEVERCPGINEENKRDFWKRQTQYFDHLMGRGVLVEQELKGRAQELLTQLREDNRYPFILRVNGAKSVPCYSYGEAKSILKEGSGEYKVYRLIGMKLIEGMMASDPKKRLSIKDVKEDEYVSGEDAPNFGEAELEEKTDVLYKDVKKSLEASKRKKTKVKTRGSIYRESDRTSILHRSNLIEY